MECAACGGAIERAAGERVGLRDTCPHCDADVHACIQCRHYEPGAYNDCHEPNAERIDDRRSANRCEWYSPERRGEATGEIEQERRAALSAADALFKKA